MKEFFGIAALAIAAATFVTALAETKGEPTDSPVALDRSAEALHPVPGTEVHTAKTSGHQFITASETVMRRSLRDPFRRPWDVSRQAQPGRRLSRGRA